jgi:hypothetical protein
MRRNQDLLLKLRFTTQAPMAADEGLGVNVTRRLQVSVVSRRGLMLVRINKSVYANCFDLRILAVIRRRERRRGLPVIVSILAGVFFSLSSPAEWHLDVDSTECFSVSFRFAPGIAFFASGDRNSEGSFLGL